MPRSFKVFTAGGPSKNVNIISDVTPLFAILSQSFPKAADRAIRHVGFVVQDQVKLAMRNMTPGYPPLTDLQSRQLIDRYKGGGRRRRKQFPGDISKGRRGLINAFGFGKRKPLTVTVGWLSKSAVFHGIRFQSGSTVPVTKKMRNYFAYLHRISRGQIKPIGRNTQTIENPARNVVEPTFARLQKIIPQIMEKRLLRNIGRISDESYTEILKGLLSSQESFNFARAFGIRLRGGVTAA